MEEAEAAPQACRLRPDRDGIQSVERSSRNDVERSVRKDAQRSSRNGSTTRRRHRSEGSDMPRPRCSCAVVAEARVRRRRWSVVGRGSARAPLPIEQSGCHLPRRARRDFSLPGEPTASAPKMATGLGFRRAAARVENASGHGFSYAACGVVPMPHNGNPGSARCIAAMVGVGRDGWVRLRA